MTARQMGSAELRDALDRFYALSTRDQLGFFGEAREHLGSEAWTQDEVEQEIDKRAEALEALEAVAADLRARGEFREGKSPTVEEFDAGAERLGLEIRSGFVVRAFLRWRIAKTVLEGGQAREKPSRRRARSAAVGRTRTHEDYLRAVRIWLDSGPERSAPADYDAFVKEENRQRGDDERPLPSLSAVTTGLRIGWVRVLAVARGGTTLENALEDRRAELLDGLSDDSLVGAEVVAVMTGIYGQNIAHHVRKGTFPVPAAKVGRNMAWMLGDVKASKAGRRVPERKRFFFQDEVVDLRELASKVGIKVDYVRTLLNHEAWHRVPRPDGKVGGAWYWLRSNLDI
jgi:predicted DNA-binding transcriptional regulator AlpA